MTKRCLGRETRCKRDRDPEGGNGVVMATMRPRGKWAPEETDCAAPGRREAAPDWFSLEASGAGRMIEPGHALEVRDLPERMREAVQDLAQSSLIRNLLRQWKPCSNSHDDGDSADHSHGNDALTSDTSQSQGATEFQHNFC